VNPIFRAAAENLQEGTLMGGLTVMFFAVFVGWAISAYAPWNRERWEKAGRMPLNVDGGGQ
jgi:cbb3-type cytochrome oxidase subunit 3